MAEDIIEGEKDKLGCLFSVCVANKNVLNQSRG